MRAGIEPVRNWPKYNQSLTTGSSPVLAIVMRVLKKRCRIVTTGGLGVSFSFRSPPRLGGIGG
jgi:hypothetical protein